MAPRRQRVKWLHLLLRSAALLGSFIALILFIILAGKKVIESLDSTLGAGVPAVSLIPTTSSP